MIEIHLHTRNMGHWARSPPLPFIYQSSLVARLPDFTGPRLGQTGHVVLTAEREMVLEAEHRQVGEESHQAAARPDL